jgi:hypothetical protein
MRHTDEHLAPHPASLDSNDMIIGANSSPLHMAENLSSHDSAWLEVANDSVRSDTLNQGLFATQEG